MDLPEREKVYRDALAKWGEWSQKLMAIEEMAELIQAICKDFRGLLDLPNVVEEMADVRIMVEQLELVFDRSADVKQAMDAKIARLSEMLSKE